MRRFRFVPVLLSLALLTSLVLSLSGAPPAEAGGKKINSEFNLVENPSFVDPITGASGEGEFELNGKNLDKLKFELEIDAEDLTPNAWYYLSVTVRETFDGGIVPVAIVVVGMARADDEGRLEFEGRGVLPNVFEDPTPGVSTWRIDQQVRQLGSGEKGNCVECILVCSPTTKVELVDGKLVPFVP